MHCELLPSWSVSWYITLLLHFIDTTFTKLASNSFVTSIWSSICWRSMFLFAGGVSDFWCVLDRKESAPTCLIFLVCLWQQGVRSRQCHLLVRLKKKILSALFWFCFVTRGLFRLVTCSHNHEQGSIYILQNLSGILIMTMVLSKFDFVVDTHDSLSQVLRPLEGVMDPLCLQYRMFKIKVWS